MTWALGRCSQSGAAPDAYDGRVTETAETLRIAISQFNAVVGDLDGDGVDEIIVVAERNTSGSLNPANPGDYSIAFMRKLVEGEVQSAILGSYVVEEPADESWIVALDTYRIAAVADLNGDGRMEIAVNGRYYEGSWTTIYDYINDDLGPWEVLAVGCGS